ncbi:MAG: hypothetical protein IPL48_15745 [Bacteroidetes bacterium]|nr:hypothetical protein [Bacteroidota bacterium]
MSEIKGLIYLNKCIAEQLYRTVLNLLLHLLSENFANTSTIYNFEISTKEVIKNKRTHIAELIGVVTVGAYTSVLKLYIFRHA